MSNVRQLDPRDRNDRAKIMQQQQLQQTQMRAAIAMDFAAGKINVLDRFGNAIEKGALVLYALPNDMVWEVTSVEPVLDGGAPLGTVKLDLRCTIPSYWAPNQPSIPIVRVGRTKTVEELAIEQAEMDRAAGDGGTKQEPISARLDEIKIDGTHVTPADVSEVLKDLAIEHVAKDQLSTSQE